LGHKDHKVPRVSQEYLEIPATKGLTDVLEILVSKASEDLLAMLEL